MNVCKLTLLLFFAAAAAGSLYANPASQETGEQPRRRFARWDKDSPEAKATMKRRYEIMILLQAYKIVPEELKTGLRAEIMRRLHEDYIANRQHRENVIRFMEAELTRLRARQESDSPEKIDSVMSAEFERLLNMPIDMHNIDNRNIQ